MLELHADGTVKWNPYESHGISTSNVVSTEPNNTPVVLVRGTGPELQEQGQQEMEPGDRLEASGFNADDIYEVPG